jgi:hypothetical protein
MRSSLKFLVPTILLAGLACQPRPAAPVIYGPWEEGLTLIYEDPSQPKSRQSEDRRQVRVAHSTLNSGSPNLIQLDLTSIRSQVGVLARYQDGGIDLVEENGQVIAQILPPHFPNTGSWVDHGVEYRVLGRAAWEGAALLPPGTDPTGVWVEARTSHGYHRRTLYLPNLGEVESREERAGAWVVVNRLVARGFTDLPVFKRS